MKRVLFFVVALLIFGYGHAQYGSKEQVSAFKKIQSVEEQFMKEKTDEEAVKLITEHKAAKQEMEKKMMLMDGYGNISKDKPSIDKFRAKCEKKDPKFKALSDKETQTRMAKEDYIKSINEDYKRLHPVAFPD